MQFTVTKDELNTLDLSEAKEYISWSQHQQYFDKPAGSEFYRLISFIAQRFPDGSTFLDLGTGMGLSSCALATNKAAKVVAFDIFDHISDDPAVKTIRNLSNIDFHIKDFLEDIKSLANSASIIILDLEPHDGIQELEFMQHIREVGYKGIVICDDIALNDGMKQFWDNISERKMVVTEWGHWSGTGIVFFSNDINITFE